MVFCTPSLFWASASAPADPRWPGPVAAQEDNPPLSLVCPAAPQLGYAEIEPNHGCDGQERMWGTDHEKGKHCLVRLLSK